MKLFVSSLPCLKNCSYEDHAVAYRINWETKPWYSGNEGILQVNQQDRVLMNSWNELCYLLWTGKLNNILEQKHFKQCTEIKMLYLANAKQFGFVRKQFNLFWYPRMKQSAIIMTPYWYSTCLFDLYITYGFLKIIFRMKS